MDLATITQEIKNKVGAHSALEAVIKFDFGDDGVIHINGTASPTVISNDNDDADCTVKISMSDFVKLADGSLNPQMAFMMGKLKVEGDMSLALQLGTILDGE